MDDKITPSSDATEYKFNESEVGAIDASTPDPASSTPTSSSFERSNVDNSSLPHEEVKKHFKFDFKNIDRKRFMVPGVIVISILLLYTIFSFYSSKKEQNLEQKKIGLQTEAALMQKQNMATDASAARSSLMSKDLGVSSNNVTQMQNDIKLNADNIMQYEKNTQDRVVNLNAAITKTEQEILGVNQHLDQLTTTVQQILLEVEKIREATKPKVKKAVRRPPVAYHVRAIVPGRVWLESAKGKTVSLCVGSKLEGYGVVRIISPRHGMVVMSNGSIIQYGVNDF
ncbi:MAG: hypothetical protein KKE11_00440 [Gammaproteobacteria bacterium]|nr:hypothetical protein [Gammaproteobacteria bacterium]